MNVPHAITKKPPTITPAAATKGLDIKRISHSGHHLYANYHRDEAAKYLAEKDGSH
jgi:hypothetical protein